MFRFDWKLSHNQFRKAVLHVCFAVAILVTNTVCFVAGAVHERVKLDAQHVTSLKKNVEKLAEGFARGDSCNE